MALIPSTLRRIAAGTLLAIVVACCSPATPAAGQSIDLRLNVFYTDKTDASQGGSWEVRAISSGQGISAVSFGLTGVDSVTSQVPTGEVNGAGVVNAGFQFFDAFDLSGDVTQVVAAQAPVPLSGAVPTGAFFGVGVVANGSPSFNNQPAGTNSLSGSPSLGDLQNFSGAWAATPDPFDTLFDSGATIATGTFAAGSLPAFATGQGALTGQVFTSFSVEGPIGDPSPQLAPSVTVVATADLITSGGDYNGDGQVNAADFSIWRDNFGATGLEGIAGDGTLDGVVDLADYELWKANYNVGAATPATATPEPQAAALAILAGALSTMLSPRKQAFSAAVASGFKNSEYGGKLLDTPKTRSHNASSR